MLLQTKQYYLLSPKSRTEDYEKKWNPFNPPPNIKSAQCRELQLNENNNNNNKKKSNGSLAGFPTDQLKEGIMLSLKQFTLQGICLLLPP